MQAASNLLASSTAPLVVALVGNPNIGKSTLFNALTGSNARVGNFPGVTVERKVGSAIWDERCVTLIDLPGSYSLAPRSADEMVAVDVLLGRRGDTPKPDVILCILDASNLERNMYLFSQVRELGIPVVAVLNMIDLATRQGISIHVQQLADRLGVPVVLTEAHRGIGIEDIGAAALTAAGHASSAASDAVFPGLVEQEVESLCLMFSDATGHPPSFLVRRALFDVGGYAEQAVQTHLSGESLTLFRQGIARSREKLAAAGIRFPAAEAKARYAWAKRQLASVITREPRKEEVAWSDRIDAWLTSPILGAFVLFLCLFVVFQLLSSAAMPLQDGIESGVTWLGEQVSAVLPPGMLRSLLVDGVIAGVGGVIVFVPQIALLFFAIAALEDSGYMARAAFLLDKPMTAVGLSGKSFLPLMSSFACAVPGIMATRVIENRRDRLLTILVAPLMSCSARLPIYLLMTHTFVPDIRWLSGWISLRTLVLLGFYALGPVVAVPVAYFIRRVWLPGPPPPFVMELPPFKWPSIKVLWGRVRESVFAFLERAGTLIFAASVVVWAAGYFPANHSEIHSLEKQIESLAKDDPNVSNLEARLHAAQSTAIEKSLLGQAGRLLAPAVAPLGWDWRIGVGVIASFPAREVIIAVLGSIYSLGPGAESSESSEGGLAAALRDAKWPDGRAVYTLPVALSIMVFFALCAQCVSTLSVMRRETNSWFWPTFAFLYMTALAYLGALVTYQIGSRL